MADKLQVDLVAGNAVPATKAVNDFTSALVKSDATAKKLDGGAVFAKNFDKEIAAVERRSLNLAFTLKKIGETTIGTKGVDGLGRAAQRAEADLRSAYARLRQIEVEMSKTNDPVVLKKLQIETKKANLDLDRLQNKIDRVAAGRQAAAARRPAGSSFDAGGLAGKAAAAGVPFAGEAVTGFDAAAALGIGTASLAVFGALAIAGVAIVKYSESIRAEAERRLKAEEAIQGAINRQIIASKEALKAFRENDAEVNRQRELSKSLAANNDAEALKRRAEFLRELRDKNPTGPNAKRFDDEAAQNEARANAVLNQRQADAERAFDQRNENFKKAQEQAREFEKRRLESINQGRARIEELGKSTDDLFKNLFAKRGATNPFVSVFTEAEAAIESTRIATANLSKELQRQALDMVAANNANVLFAARLDARLQSVDLRGDAQKFRSQNSVFDTAKADLIVRQAMEKFQRETAAGLFRNPDNLAAFQGFGSNKQQLDLFNFRRQQDESSGIFRNPIFDEERRRELARREPGADLSVSERLDRQLKVIASLKPENDVQRAEADRKIIALTNGLNPADLTDAQRNAAAAARENEASRLDNAETAARSERAEAANVQKSIDKNIAELLDIAKKEGLTGVIRIINEAEDDARASLGKRKRAGELDARDLMD